MAYLRQDINLIKSMMESWHVQMKAISTKVIKSAQDPEIQRHVLSQLQAPITHILMRWVVR